MNPPVSIWSDRLRDIGDGDLQWCGSDGRLSTDDVRALSQAIANGVNSELTGIELDACDIDDDGACALAAALASDGAPRLQWLLLNDHARLGDRGVVAIARSIAAQPQLRGLALSMCKYSDAGVAALCAALETNESVTSLNLFGNRLSDAGSDRLRDAIAVNATLERVQMPVSRPELSELPPLEERHEARAAFLADANRCDERRRSHEAIIEAAAAIETAKLEKARAAAEREAALVVSQQKQLRANLFYAGMTVLALLLAILWRR